MNKSYIDEPMLEAYVYETSQIIESLEQLMIQSEKKRCFSEEDINEIFRLMHTIKGSSAMMMFNEISSLSHIIEDIFYLIRGQSNCIYDFHKLVDYVLESIDFFKIEIMKIKNGEDPDGETTDLTSKVKIFLERFLDVNALNDKKSLDQAISKNNQKYYVHSSKIKKEMNYYKAKITFEKNCEMENIRAYTIIHNMKDLVETILFDPHDIIENDQTVEIIRKSGFIIAIKTDRDKDIIKSYLENTVFLESLDFDVKDESWFINFEKIKNDYSQNEDIIIPEISEKHNNTKNSFEVNKSNKNETNGFTSQNIISVNVDKLDKLMDMVGELVISEAMVTQNPEVLKHEIDSFDKASRQLHKISSDIQDMVMSIRMVPLSTTFMKMHRIVRDMTRRLSKDAILNVYGEETEVDKNIIEKIADPLMHIIRNALDHGIENVEERLMLGKNKQGTITLEAKNSGSDVLIVIKDDGKGLDKNLIFEKAYNQGLVHQPMEEMKEKDIYNLILHPGFSMKEEVTEFSGRGVGMDVVAKNIESVGGSVIVDSHLGSGTTITLKIPLTLAIIDGMNIKVGNSRFTLPIVSISQSFKPKNEEVFKDTEGREMIMVRGLCYPIIKLYDHYSLETDIDKYEDGILIMVDEEDRSCCIFADELLGQQQVVVKSLPNYIKKYRQVNGLGGCTLLGDGSISLILDVGGLNLSGVY